MCDDVIGWGWAHCRFSELTFSLQLLFYHGQSKRTTPVKGLHTEICMFVGVLVCIHFYLLSQSNSIYESEPGPHYVNQITSSKKKGRVSRSRSLSFSLHARLHTHTHRPKKGLFGTVLLGCVQMCSVCLCVYSWGPVWVLSWLCLACNREVSVRVCHQGKWSIAIKTHQCLSPDGALLVCVRVHVCVCVWAFLATIRHCVCTGGTL